jgi:hypothetical protein
VSYPPPQAPWPPGQPDPNQPPYDAGYSGGPGPDPNAPASYGQQPYGPDQNYGSPHPQESYTTEPPYSGQPQSGQPYSGQPYSGQPYSGQPYSAQQYSGQPYSADAYGNPAQPGYATGYPAQAQPVPGQPYGAPPQPPRRGRGGLIALVAGAALLLLLVCSVGGVLIATSGNDKPSAGPTRSAAPSASATSRSAGASPSSTVKPEYPATIAMPKTVAGLTKLDNPELNKQADETATKIKDSTNADSAVAGYYAPAGDVTKTVGLVGAAVKIANPATELDSAFTNALSLSGTREVNAGPMGGIMKCGNTSSGGATLSVCGWADGGSLVLGIFLNRSLDDSAALLRQIRTEILKRG